MTPVENFVIIISIIIINRVTFIEMDSFFGLISAPISPFKGLSEFVLPFGVFFSIFKYITRILVA